MVHDKVRSGRYLSASEVVREALRLMEDRDQTRELKLEELRKYVAVGINQADRGDVGPLDIEATLARGRNRRTDDCIIDN
jgi:antitoxin ParD1/3/4